MDIGDFVSVPDELLSAAVEYGNKLESDGYRVAREPQHIAYPRRPIFVAKRRPVTIIFEVYSQLRFDEIREWIRYGQACSSDTRFIAGLTKDAPASQIEMADIQALRGGLWMIGPSGPFEALPPHDLPLNVHLPELPRGLKGRLGAAYDHFNRGQWREGFVDACQVLEQEARAYLKLHMTRGRVVLVTSRGRVLVPDDIARLPMGELAKRFAMIPTPSATDSKIEQALTLLNKERVDGAHYKGMREATLRRKVREHMFVIVNTLRVIKGIKS